MPEKILVVDDDIDSLKLIGLMLQRHGYEVSAANAGHQAISKATADHPDLIILDVMMPDMNGYEVCRRLRASADTAAIPIIMFTAKTLIDDKVAGFEAGADDYLTKPTHPAELASRVRAILARRKQASRQEPSRGATIGVIGAKGGVGTTTLALNMAAARLQAGDSPLVADFRLGSGSMGLFLGLGQSQGAATLLARPANEIKTKSVEDELVMHTSGLRLLLSSPSLEEAQMTYMVESGIAVIRALRSIGRPTFFDLGTSYTAHLSRLQREMDMLVMVVEPLKVSLAIAKELIPQLEAGRTAPGRIHIVVVNRTQSGMQTPWHEVEQLLGQEIRAIISSAPELAFTSMNAAMPMVVHQPNAIVSSQIMKLSEDLNTRVTAQRNEVTT
jgi:CheY-like chemotaxis protein/MinD-like ATPase involved in chromosome partitioning or flagellar assembly